MCGLTGVFDPCYRNDLGAIVSRLADALVHRGPDDADVWVDGEAGIALGHRRLSILDVSAAGHQPMVSASGRYVIAFNGEIYNHIDLRRALESQGQSPPWRGHSDTETLLAAIEACGIPEALRKSVGMFAFALWDRTTRTLTLARDRLGEKPLYYGWVRGALVFGSELKAIRAYPGFDHVIDRWALALFMRHNYVPAPWSIYEGVWKLPPGCYVQFGGSGRADAVQSQRGEIKPYWSVRTVAEAGLRTPFSGTEAEAVDELERLLRRSIAGQMIADVPLGAFLSGGIDSSAVVALMQAQSSRPIKTFTIGFREGEYNEAEHAKAVARHLGTDHTELYVTPAEALAVIPKLPMLYDEPFADSSQLPTHLVAQLARQHVKVALSGDGGDELFCGYHRYFRTMRLWRYIGAAPMPLRLLAANVLTALSPSGWNRIFQMADTLLPQRLRYGNPGDKVHKLAALFGARRPEEIYLHLVSHWKDPARLVLGAEEPVTPITDPSSWLDCPDLEHRMMYLDMLTYLPDDILVKVDRAAMGVSLETRVPLLDHRVLEFAWQVPLTMKIRHGQGKWLLRQVLYRYVPQAMMERPKMGFGVPIGDWLRGPLKEWAEDLLNEARLRREGYLDPKPIRQKWQEHLSGRRNWQYLLWDVLMFQAWLEAMQTNSCESEEAIASRSRGIVNG